MLKTSFAIQVIRSRYEGMISMFCSQCGAPMGDNDKFCGVCGAPNTEAPHVAAGSVPQGQPQPQPFVAPQPAMNVPKGCMAQAFNDMIKVPGALVRVCQIAFLPALICVVSVLVLFIPVIGGIAAAIGFLLAYVASVCGAGFAIEWGRDLSLKDDNGIAAPTSDLIRASKNFNEDCDKARRFQTGCKDTGSNNDAENFTIAVAHARKKAFRERLRISQSNRQRVNGSHNHGLSYTHFYGRKP